MKLLKLLRTEEVDRILAAVKFTTCLLDPCLFWLVKTSRDGVQVPLGGIINLTLTSGTFTGSLKEAVEKPLLKKPSLNPMVLANYHPVSNLPSNLLE